MRAKIVGIDPGLYDLADFLRILLLLRSAYGGRFVFT